MCVTWFCTPSPDLGIQSQSKVCLSVRANLCRFGGCVYVCVYVGVWGCGYVDVFMCVQKQNKELQWSTARTTRVDGTCNSVLFGPFVGHFVGQFVQTNWIEIGLVPLCSKVRLPHHAASTESSPH